QKAAEQLKPSAPVRFHISSRTDRGVHALANAAHLDIQRAPGRAPFTGPQLLHGLNRHLKPEPIRPAQCPHPEPSLPRSPLDMAAMRAAAQLLLGTHDFSTFRAPHAEAAAQSPVRTLQLLQLQPGHGLLGQHHLPRAGLSLQAGSCQGNPCPVCPQVRRMVGALVAVGQGRLAPERLQELLELRDPRALPPQATAPPQGLFLHSVQY
ncbi:PUSL1 protein, partial [Calcarius ornatus]|nr:PUSL1 protein [Calcarius ornatus]